MARKKSGMNQHERRAVKKAGRAAKEAARKNPKGFLIAVAVLLAIALLAGACYYLFVVKKWGKEGEPLKTGELSVHFLELGNKYAGDCTLIKIGNTEVLIDAGSRKGSAETLVPEIKKLCTDGVLEYVIATHADQDHIAAFIGTKDAPGIFDSFACRTIIDFPLTNKADGTTVKEYCAKRDAEVAGGAVHYTALECWKEENGA